MTTKEPGYLDAYYAAQPPTPAKSTRNTAADRRRIAEGGRWKAAARAFLAQPGNERCAYCGDPAECVDHAVAHKGDPELFWNRRNWRPACLACNSAKAAQSEGGFGHAPRAFTGRRVRSGADESGMPTDPLHPWNK